MTADVTRRLWGAAGRSRRPAVASVAPVATAAQLRAALAGEQFAVHYQPEVALTSGTVVGVEALVRWSHPVHGLLLPSAFVPQIEGSPLIVPFGRWVLHQACAALARLQVEHPGLRMNVNVSARQLSDDPTLVGAVADELAGAGVAAARLTLEITETALMHDRARCRDALRALRRTGVQVAIDDFGTGYSSLASLTDLPASILKLDKRFVDVLHRGGRHTEIVRCVLDLAASLGMAVTAEGIETPQQVRLLDRLGCATGQGFYFSRPLPERLLLGRLDSLPMPARLDRALPSPAHASPSRAWEPASRRFVTATGCARPIGA